MSSGSIPVFRPSLTNSSQAGGISYRPLVLSMARQPTSSRNDEMPACRIIERFAFSRPLPWPKWVQAPTTNGSAAVPVAGNKPHPQQPIAHAVLPPPFLARRQPLPHPVLVQFHAQARLVVDRRTTEPA